MTTRPAPKATALDPVRAQLAHLLAAWLVETFPGQFWLLGLYVILMSIVSLVCVQLLAETSRKDLGTAEA